MRHQTYRHMFRPMTVVGLAVAIATLTAGASDAGKRVEREDRKTLAALDHTGLIVENSKGRVVVIGDADATEVTVVATRVAIAASEIKAQELLEKLSFTMVVRDAMVVIRTENESEEGSRSIWSVLKGGRSSTFVNYAVEVPGHFDVQVSTTSGEVRVRGIEGHARVHATSASIELRDIGADGWVELTSGDLDASDIRGALDVRATSGTIEADGVGGSLRIDATTGDVVARRIEGDAIVNLVRGNLTIEHCLGDVVFRTSSGDAEIMDVVGGISAITSSGDLDVMILPLGEKEFILSSSSGDIDVRYATPLDFGFVLDIETSTGAIEGDMAIRVEKVTRRQLRGIVGTGTSRVMIETASGDVSIAERAKSDVRKTKQTKSKK